MRRLLWRWKSRFVWNDYSGRCAGACGGVVGKELMVGASQEESQVEVCLGGSAGHFQHLDSKGEMITFFANKQDFFKGGLAMERLRYYIPGSLLVLMGLLIVAFPEILVALVAAMVITLGAGALFIGHTMRKVDRGARGVYEWNACDDDGFCRIRIGHSPIFRRWCRRS